MEVVARRGKNLGREFPARDEIVDLGAELPTRKHFVAAVFTCCRQGCGVDMGAESYQACEGKARSDLGNPARELFGAHSCKVEYAGPYFRALELLNSGRSPIGSRYKTCIAFLTGRLDNRDKKQIFAQEQNHR